MDLDPVAATVGVNTPDWAEFLDFVPGVGTLSVPIEIRTSAALTLIPTFSPIPNPNSHWIPH